MCLEFPKTVFNVNRIFPGSFLRHSLLGKNVCLNFFQSGWWSTDALGCHLIGIRSGIGDSLKCIINIGTNRAAEMKRSDCLLCENVYSPCGGGWANTTAKITTFVMMWYRPQDCDCFYRSCPFLCNWPGLHGLLLFTVGKFIIIILEILQDCVFVSRLMYCVQINKADKERFK